MYQANKRLSEQVHALALSLPRHSHTTPPEQLPIVSQLIRDNFTFVCFPVPDVTEAIVLKKGLVPLLARYPLGAPSPDWLGRFAVNERIRLSGLWNAQNLDAEPLTLSQFERLQQLAAVTSR